eukprot:3398959-Prymnesium_polylepis.1
MGAESVRNPLFLSLLLQELHRTGLAWPDRGLEQSTFGSLVREALQLLWAGREGLAQPELTVLDAHHIEHGNVTDMLQNLAAKQLVIRQHGRYTLRHDS